MFNVYGFGRWQVTGVGGICQRPIARQCAAMLDECQRAVLFGGESCLDLFGHARCVLVEDEVSGI